MQPCQDAQVELGNSFGGIVVLRWGSIKFKWKIKICGLALTKDTVLYYIIWYDIILYFIVLYYIILYYIILYMVQNIFAVTHQQILQNYISWDCSDALYMTLKTSRILF